MFIIEIKSKRSVEQSLYRVFNSTELLMSTTYGDNWLIWSSSGIYLISVSQLLKGSWVYQQLIWKYSGSFSVDEGHFGATTGQTTYKCSGVCSPGIEDISVLMKVNMEPRTLLGRLTMGCTIITFITTENPLIFHIKSWGTHVPFSGWNTDMNEWLLKSTPTVDMDTLRVFRPKIV